MTRGRLRITPGAREDIREIHSEYVQISENLSARFGDELLNVLEQIESMPELYAVVSLGCRQVRLNRFPHVVTYTIDGELVVVLAVLHGLRDPKHWRERVE